MMSKSAPPSAEPRSKGLQFHRTVRWLAMLALLLAALFVAGRYVLFDELDEQIRAHIETMLKSQFDGCQVQVQSARRIAGKGVLVSGVSIKTSAAKGDAPQGTILIDELEIHCGTDLSDFLQQDVVIERLIARRASVSACRLADGSWLIPRPRTEKTQQALPPIDIEDGQLRCWDVRQGEESALVLQQIRGDLLPLSRTEKETGQVQRAGALTAYRFRGKCGSDHFQELVLVAEITPATGEWQAQGTLQSLRLTPDWLQAGPWKLPAPWPAGLEVRCLSDVKWAVRSPATPVGTDKVPRSSAVAASDWQVMIQAEVREGYVNDPRLPYPFTDIKATVGIDSSGINVSQFTGRCGTSELTGEFKGSGWEASSPWRMSVQVNRLALNDQLASKLPAKWRKDYQRFSPQGHVDLDLTLQSAAGKIHTNLKVQCQNTSFVYDKFPYPLEQGRGLVQWADGILVIDGFQATAHGQLVRIDGRIVDPEKFSSGWIEVAVAGPIPLDAPLLEALNARTRESIVALQPTGMVTLHQARFERKAQEPVALHQQFDLELHDCSIKPEKFPYPIDRIRGRIIGEDGVWKLQEMIGRSGGAYVQCTGSWQQGTSEKSSLVLNLTATDVPLDNTLREAIGQLNPKTGRVWESLQPQGTLDRLTVQLRHPGPDGKPEIAIQGQKWPRRVYAPDPGLLVKPQWFPYRMDHVTGMFNYRNGQVTLTGIRAQHGKTVIRLDGSCFFPMEGPWDAKLTNVTVDHLLTDHEFITALPLPIRKAIAKLNITGPLMLRGQLQLAKAMEGNRKLNAQWDLKIAAAGATLESGLRLDHIHGGVRLFGLYDKDGFRSRGELDIDSLFFRKEQLTNLRGPLWIDSRQVLFGAWSQHQVESQKPQSISAKSLGGRIVLDAQLITGPDARFFMQAGLQQGDLAYILNQRGVDAKVTGKADATLQLSGRTSGVHTWRGRGSIRLRNADIYQVPLMVALLSLVSVRPPDTTAFTASDINYRIHSDRVYLDRIRFSGDAISLEGNGWLDFDKKINLSFYTLVGRSELRIPIVSSLLAEASRNLLKIQVVGTLDKPRVSGSAFPELDEAMQNILNDLSRPRLDLIERLPRTGAE
jgi:hypothetical protein